MDFPRFDGQKGPIRDFTIRSIRCVSRRIVTWQIVYLSTIDACPTISPGALEFDPEKIVPSLFFKDIFKISIETKYQKSPSFPIVLNFLRL